MNNKTEIDEWTWWMEEVQAAWPKLSQMAMEAIVDHALTYNHDDREHIGSLYTIDEGCDWIEADDGDVAIAFHYRFADRPEICDPNRIGVEAVAFAPDGTILEKRDVG